MAPISYKPEKKEDIELKTKALSVKISANTSLSAALNSTKINIGENSSSMGNIVIGGSLVLFLGASFKASLNVFKYSYILSLGLAVSNYANKADVQYTDLVAAYSEILDNYDACTDKVETALNTKRNFLKRAEVASDHAEVARKLTKMSEINNLMSERLTEITNTEERVARNFAEISKKKEEAANLAKDVRNQLDALIAKYNVTAVTEKIVAKTESETGLHTHA